MATAAFSRPRAPGDAMELRMEAPIADVFLELIIVSLGMTAAFYPVLAMLQARAEEAAGRAELVLSTATSRTSWLASHLGLALGGAVVVLGTGGAARGVTYGLGPGNVPANLARLLAGALLHVPAAWVLGGVALLLVGVAPRYAAAIAWAALLYEPLIGEVLGPVFSRICL